MQRVDTVITAEWLVPVDSSGSSHTNHGLAIRDGAIVAVGPNECLEAEYQPDERVDLPHHVLIPSAGSRPPPRFRIQSESNYLAQLET